MLVASITILLPRRCRQNPSLAWPDRPAGLFHGDAISPRLIARLVECASPRSLVLKRERLRLSAQRDTHYSDRRELRLLSVKLLAGILYACAAAVLHRHLRAAGE